MIKYYYRIGRYTILAAGRMTASVIGNIDSKFNRDRPISYDHHGMDVRSWQFTGEVKEVTKDQYDQIVEDDKRIIEQVKELYGLHILTHHGPFTENVV